MVEHPSANPKVPGSIPGPAQAAFPNGPQLGPSGAHLGPNRGPTGAQPGPTWNAAWVSHTGVMDYDEACIMHLTPGVVYNFPKAVGV